MPIPKKPVKAPDVDRFIGGAKASLADRAPAKSAESREKKMFSARIDPATIRMVRLYAASEGKTKEEIVQEALDNYFKNRKVPG